MQSRWVWAFWISHTFEVVRDIHDTQSLLSDIYPSTSAVIDRDLQRYLDRFMADRPELKSVDITPLYIHAIEDPTARQAATQAYLESIV